MELRSFLEQDIIRFIEDRLSAEYLRQQSIQGTAQDRTRDDEVAAAFLGRDYEKELFQSLRDHNIIKAKHVLHEVKDAFASYPVDSPERQQLKALLHALYEKFKDYLEEQSTFSKLEHAIDKVEEMPESAAEALGSTDLPSEFFKQEQTPRESAETNIPIERPLPPPKHQEIKAKIERSSSAAPVKTPPSVSKPSSAARITQEPNAYARPSLEEQQQERQAVREAVNIEAEHLVKVFLGHLEALNAALDAGDAVTAYHHYRKARTAFAQMPEEHKRRHYHKMMDHHHRVSALIQKNRQEKQQQSQRKATQQPTFRTEVAEVKTASPLERYVQAIDQAILNRDLLTAMRQYEDLRTAVNRLPVNEKRNWFDRLHQLYQKISRERNVQHGRQSVEGRIDTKMSTKLDQASPLVEHHQRKLTKNTP